MHDQLGPRLPPFVLYIFLVYICANDKKCFINTMYFINDKFLEKYRNGFSIFLLGFLYIIKTPSKQPPSFGHLKKFILVTPYFKEKKKEILKSEI
jgi:hypothetical protein